MDTFIKNFSTASGTNQSKLLQFLTSFREVLILRLPDQTEVVLAVLHKTRGQLRAIWADTVQERVAADTLITNVLTFFSTGKSFWTLLLLGPKAGQSLAKLLPVGAKYGAFVGHFGLLSPRDNSHQPTPSDPG